MDQDEFFDQLEIGDPVPPLTVKAVTKTRFPKIFGDLQLQTAPDKSREKAKDLGVDAIHTTKFFGGVYMLHFISEMITAWIPNPKGWIQGGSLTAKFVNLVNVNEMITCCGKVKDKPVKDNKKHLICSVWVEKETGEKAVIGEACIAFE